MTRRRRRFGHPPRRAIPTRAGIFTLIAPMILGVAGVTAGNNLLFLLLGASLGMIVLSGILSEEAIRGVRIRVTALQPPEAGSTARLAVEWVRANGERPAYALRLDERRFGLLHRESFRRAPSGLLRSELPVLRGRHAKTRAARVFEKRGRAELFRCEIATVYPFGLLRKVRDVEVHADLWVRPARVKLPAELRSGRTAAPEGHANVRRGHGIEAYGLREWTERDPIHRIHALRSARHPTDVMVETAEEDRPVAWVAVVNGPACDPEALDRACELAAAYARDRAGRNERVGLVSVGVPSVEGDLDRVMDRLARLVPTDGELRVPPGTVVLCPTGASLPAGVRGLRVGAEGLTS